MNKIEFSKIDLINRSAIWQLVAVIFGTVLLALSSQISVPMVPVPITMQTFAVTLIGAVYGWRLGALTVLAWLAEAAAGLPVLAGGTGGMQPFFGATAGYLLAFPIAAAATGWLAERGWSGSRLLWAFAAMIAGNAICLIIGGAWLAVLIGAEKALMLGVVPFVVGGILKSALGAVTLRVFARR